VATTAVDPPPVAPSRRGWYQRVSDAPGAAQPYQAGLAA